MSKGVMTDKEIEMVVLLMIDTFIAETMAREEANI